MSEMGMLRHLRYDPTVMHYPRVCSCLELRHEVITSEEFGGL